MTWNPTTSPTTVTVQKSMNDTKSSTKETAHNRAEDIRRDTESFKDFSITLTDIDNAVMEHLDKNISPMVVDSAQNIKVPIIYADPEKWKSMSIDGVIRDGQGKIQLPIFAFTRISFEKNQNMMTLNRHLTYPVLSKYTNINKYDTIDALKNNDKKLSNEIYAVTLPDHVTVEYKCVVQTNFTSQANSVVEKINFATEEYWGDKNRFKFRTYASAYSFTTENPSDGDRIVKSEFTLSVHAYLLPTNFEDKRSTTSRYLTPRRLMWGIETMTSGDNNGIVATKKIKGNIYLYSSIGEVWRMMVDTTGSMYTIKNGTSGEEYIELFSSPSNRWKIYVDDSGSLSSSKLTDNVEGAVSCQDHVDLYSTIGEKWRIIINDSGSLLSSRI